MSFSSPNSSIPNVNNFADLVDAMAAYAIEAEEEDEIVWWLDQ